MQRTSSVLNMVMTSVRAGARAVRSKRSLWRKALLFILPLISLFSLVVCPATSVFAAYGQSFTAPVTQDNPQASNYSIRETWSAQSFVSLESYGSLYMTVDWFDQDLFSDGYVMQGAITGYLNVTAPTVTNWENKSNQIIIDDLSYDTIFTQVGLEPYVYSTGRGYFSLKISQINQRPRFGVMITYRVISNYDRVSTSGSIDDFMTYKPTVTTSNVSFAGEYLPVTALLPDLHTLKESLVGSNGWMSTINTNLQTLVTAQSTSNSYLQQLRTGQASEITHLSNIYTRVGDIKAAQATQIAHENTIIANQETQIDQLQQIVDYVNNTEAASVVDDANDEFTDQAAAMESGQAALEEDADDNIDAVDVAGNLAVVTTYRQSLNFWMRCVNYLPTATGSIWEAFVFGVFLAFILFILGLNK